MAIKIKNIKSWQISAVGIIPTTLLILAMLLKQLISGNAYGFALGTVYAGFAFIGMALFLIPAVLLRKENTKETGAGISILLGALLLMMIFTKTDIGGSAGQFIVFGAAIPGIFSILAGAYYFWKKQ